MQQKCSKLDHMTLMNNLVQKFYKSEIRSCLGVFTYPHYIAFPFVQHKAKKVSFSTKFGVIFTTKFRKTSFSRQDTHQIFSFEHFYDPWVIPNQKIWVSYPGIFFLYFSLFRGTVLWPWISLLWHPLIIFIR